MRKVEQNPEKQRRIIAKYFNIFFGSSFSSQYYWTHIVKVCPLMIDVSIYNRQKNLQ
jgi:hypothetical protein